MNLAWQIKFDEGAKKDIAKLDKQAGKRIISFLSDRLAKLENPRSLGKALKGSKLGEFWRYRVGDYRIIASIQDATLSILIVKIGNRKKVYR